MTKYNKFTRAAIHAALLMAFLLLLVWGIRKAGYVEGFDDSSDSPQGVPASQIPSGDEDMYILKSQVVPPVCPRCPTVASCPRSEPAPPCPACERCPEPSFDCKKIPNYSGGNGTLPQPLLGDFSAFS